jgi:hypothetical protein
MDYDWNLTRYGRVRMALRRKRRDQPRDAQSWVIASSKTIKVWISPVVSRDSQAARRKFAFPCLALQPASNSWIAG